MYVLHHTPSFTTENTLTFAHGLTKSVHRPNNIFFSREKRTRIKITTRGAILLCKNTTAQQPTRHSELVLIQSILPWRVDL